MSTIDNQIGEFYDRLFYLRLSIEDYSEWINHYENIRKNYPSWKTKEGKQIKIEDIDNNHLNNLIALLTDKEPNSTWLKAFKQEQNCREVKEKLNKLKQELSEMEEISDICL